MKKIIRIAILLVIAYFLVKLCTSQVGSIIPTGTNTETGSGTGSGNGGGWLGQRNSGNSGNSEYGNSGKSIKDVAEELERELGVGGASGTTAARTEKQVARNSSDLDATTSSGSHLTFKGLEIAGRRADFVKALQQQGFTATGAGELNGKFAGFKGCTIQVNGDNPVRSVRVLFPKTSDWNQLEADYDSIQAMLTQKYGNPQVETNRATFSTAEGDIVLDAYVQGQGNWYVILDYIDDSAISVTGTQSGSAIDDL